MSERFLAYLPLSEVGFTTADALASRIKGMYSNVPMQVQPVHQDAGSTTLGLSITIAIDDVVLAVVLVDQKLPRDAFESAILIDRMWPEAKSEMLKQKAHIILATMSPINSHAQALAAAGALTFASAALITLLPALAVVWTNGETIIAPQRFLEAAELLAKPQAPVDVWIGLRWLDAGAANDGTRQLAAQTTGMGMFIGREIEWMPSSLPPVTIYERIIGTCQYLIGAGPVINDGDTLGISEAEKIRVRFAEEGQVTGDPVMQLSVESTSSH